MRVLLIGDIVGKPGRRVVDVLVPTLRDEHQIDLVVANGENAAGGFGITPATAEEIFSSGVDIITTGDHVWDKSEAIGYLDDEPKVLRPLNFPPGVPGVGHYTYKNVQVVNLMGRVFMRNDLDCPFRTMDTLLENSPQPLVTIVDFHAEATSEKQALGWYLDGRVSAVVGTHTHVATADHRILPNGTAYVSDLGMAGPYNSVIGDEPEDVLFRFLKQMPKRLNVADGPVRLNSVLIEIDDSSGLATSIQRLDRVIE